MWENQLSLFGPQDGYEILCMYFWGAQLGIQPKAALDSCLWCLLHGEKGSLYLSSEERGGLL